MHVRRNCTLYHAPTVLPSPHAPHPQLSGVVATAPRRAAGAAAFAPSSQGWMQPRSRARGLCVSSSSAAEAPPAKKGTEGAPASSSGAYSMDDIVNVCKRRGFVFQSSEIYNGFNGFYDYGPLGGARVHACVHAATACGGCWIDFYCAPPSAGQSTHCVCLIDKHIIKIITRQWS